MSQYDERLAALVTDSVADVEPSDALEALRARTAAPSRRPWLLAAGGAMVATAAVVTAIAVLGGGNPVADDPTPVPGPATQQPSGEVEPSEATDPSGPETPGEPTALTSVPVYFAGDTPDGVRLYREFQVVETSREPLLEATSRAVSGTPDDADYRTLWPAGSTVEDATWDGDVARVSLTDVPLDLPATMNEEDARIAVQALVYSAQAALGEGRVPVQLLVDGQPSATVLGQPTSEPLANDSVLDTLARVSITTPGEGQVVAGDTLEVTGVGNSFEANIVVTIQPREGAEVLEELPFTATGYMADKLFPFEGSFDVSAYPPGEYVVVARTDDPSGNGMSHTDSKRFTVE